MIRAPIKVVLDANVLYPFTLRDTLLRAAAEGLFQVYWSRTILDEASQNLINSAMLTQSQVSRLFGAMADAFPEATVTGHEALIPVMKNQKKDRHVAAAAVKIGAHVIVTNNVKDFRQLPGDIKVLSPDGFLCWLFDTDPGGMVEILKVQAASLRRPPRSFNQVLQALAKLVPRFSAAVRAQAQKGK